MNLTIPAFGVIPTLLVELYVFLIQRVNPQESIAQGNVSRDVVGKRSVANAIDECWNAGNCNLNLENMRLVCLEAFLPTYDSIFSIRGNVRRSGIRGISWLVVYRTAERWK